MLPILLLIVCFQLSQPLSVFAMCYRYDCCYTASLGIEFSFTGTEILCTTDIYDFSLTGTEIRGIGYAVPISLLIVCFHPLRIVSMCLFMFISVPSVLWISPIIPFQISVIIFDYLIMRIRISGTPCCMNRTRRTVYILDLSIIFKKGLSVWIIIAAQINFISRTRQWSCVSIYSWSISLVTCSVSMCDVYMMWVTGSVSLMVICMKNFRFSSCRSNNPRHLLVVQIFHFISCPKPFAESLNIYVEHCYVYIYNNLCNRWLSPLKMLVRISIRARCTTICDKVCQWLATWWWYSPGRSSGFLHQ